MQKKPIASDPKAHKRVQTLLERLPKIAKKGYAFGHQEALTYGIGWKNTGSQNKSDIKTVCGDHPAVVGFELGNVEKGSSHSIDSVSFKTMRKLIRKIHKKGGIVTLSWHPDNPVSKKNAWDTTPAVASLLKGGALYSEYQDWLANLAVFLRSLKDKKGKRIPIIFRPFHEMNGGWFWWGKGHCSPQEFIRLWQETFQLLTTDLKVHNLMYCYSPNLLLLKKDFLKYYPGDAYVDMLGIDVYQHLTTALFKRHLKKDLRLLQQIAKEKNMPFALTETGLEKIKNKTWFTKVLHPAIADSGICYALVWRNDSPGHHYAPYPGHMVTTDFTRYASYDDVLFLKEVRTIK